MPTIGIILVDKLMKTKKLFFHWIYIFFPLILFGGMSYAQEFICYERTQQLLRPQIVGSSDSYTIDQIPWAVNLDNGSGDKPYCGGTLITANTVLTAAHCVKPHMVVRRVDSRGTPYGDSATVVHNVIHPDYNGNVRQVSRGDIALLRLDKSFDILTLDLPRLLPDNYRDLWGRPGDCALVVGWGATKEGGHVSSILLGTTLPIWDDNDCRDSYGDTLFEGTICAGYQDGQTGSCQGDSGGALVVEGGPSGFIQVGIVSFGYGCARPNYPTVYTRVSDYYDWIFEAVESMGQTHR